MNASVAPADCRPQKSLTADAVDESGAVVKLKIEKHQVLKLSRYHDDGHPGEPAAAAGDTARVAIASRQPY